MLSVGKQSSELKVFFIQDSKIMIIGVGVALKFNSYSSKVYLYLERRTGGRFGKTNRYMKINSTDIKNKFDNVDKPTLLADW